MPDIATLLVFAAAALALVAVPGPNIRSITTRTLSAVGAGTGWPARSG